jgi:hypothetical protein
MQTKRSWSRSPDDTLEEFPDLAWLRHDSDVRALDLGSGRDLDRSERATLPPSGAGPDAPETVATRVRLHTSMDEILYRLSVGDWDGALRAHEDLRDCVPRVTAGRLMLDTLGLDGTTEFVLTYVDGASSWGSIVDSAPFEPAETLRSLCALVDEGVVSCA